MVAINWGMLGAPVDVGGAVQQGFAFGRQARQQHRDDQRRDQFQRSAFAAYDPQTGNVDPAAMRSAFAAAGDVEGAMRFDAQHAERANTAAQRQREQVTTLARILDDATDENSYQAGRQAAADMGIDVSQVPPNFDPQWVARQRAIVGALSNEQEMTTFMREARAAGIEPGSPQFRQLFENRYAPPMQAVDITQSDGSVVRQYMPRPTASASPQAGPQPGAEVNGYRFRGGDPNDRSNWEPVQGGPTPQASGTFPW